MMFMGTPLYRVVMKLRRVKLSLMVWKKDQHPLSSRLAEVHWQLEVLQKALGDDAGNIEIQEDERRVRN